MLCDHEITQLRLELARAERERKKAWALFWAVVRALGTPREDGAIVLRIPDRWLPTVNRRWYFTVDADPEGETYAAHVRDTPIDSWGA